MCPGASIAAVQAAMLGSKGSRVPACLSHSSDEGQRDMWVPTKLVPLKKVPKEEQTVLDFTEEDLLLLSGMILVLWLC